MPTVVNWAGTIAVLIGFLQLEMFVWLEMKQKKRRRKKEEDDNLESSADVQYPHLLGKQCM